MADSKKEAAPAASKVVPAPGKTGKDASKPAAGAKPEAVPSTKKARAAAKRLAAKEARSKVKVKKSRRGGVGKRDRRSRQARKAEKIAASAQKRAAATKENPDAPPAKRPKRRPHREIASGVVKFSRPNKYHRRGAWKCVSKKIKKAPKKPRVIKKEIGGEKNGGFRMVLVKKRRNNYPTADRIRKRKTRGVFKKHTRYIRKSLKPGTICILLAGIHKGKRVVLLKVLKSGLLLINGPFSVNGCPLRRVSQNFVIATRTRLKLDDKKIPRHLNDNYFKRIRPKKSKKEGEDIFTTKKEKYTPSEQRKTDQKAMDKFILEAIRKYGKRGRIVTSLIKYLKTMFGLRRHQNPHHMIF